ncbi:MAG: hypothetical protein LWY06_08190 [Firmicutes bacterium]|nr:hypothetical protein [Bacillota bacterium]
MDKWEFITVNTAHVTWKDNGHTSASPELDKLGDEGWEMVGVEGIYIYMKRRKKGQDVPQTPFRIS